jgi:type I restriction enzyme, R subunit
VENLGLARSLARSLALLTRGGRVACIGTIADAIRAKLNPNPARISEVMGDINTLLDESITGMTIREQGPPALDLSKIDFEALAKRFRESKRKNTELEVLKAAIRAQLEKLIELNHTRADFAEKFEALIESYNAGSRSIEELFEELVKLSRSLSEEQQRHVRENMTEEELVIFDILTRPALELTTEERAEVKKVARELLNRLKQLLVLNWRQKAAARSQLKLAIEDALDSGLPRAYTPDLYRQKCSAVFEHMYESYPERKRRRLRDGEVNEEVPERSSFMRTRALFEKLGFSRTRRPSPINVRPTTMISVISASPRRR